MLGVPVAFDPWGDTLCEAAEVSADTDMAEKLRLWLLNGWPGRATAEKRSPAALFYFNR